MSDVKWIKLTTSIFDDEKIRIIESMPDADAILIIWIKLLTLAGKANANGYIYLTEKIPYTDEMLASIFNRQLSTVRVALHTFESFGMIRYDEQNYMKITNWDKHQNVMGLDKIREQTRKRVAKHRENQKLLSNESVTLQVTDGNAIDKNKKENKKEREGEKIPAPSPKIDYAENVKLTEAEYQKLVDAHGEDDVRRLLEILSLYKTSSGKKYKSDYHAIIKWVVSALDEERQKTQQTRKNQRPRAPNDTQSPASIMQGGDYEIYIPPGGG